jgi:molybdopterin/thiamine biosynthesis adenylyltransferase
MWALARTPGLQGTLHVIDAEKIDLTNLQRYVLTGQQHVGTAKVTLANRVLQSTPLVVHPHQQRWGEYLRTRNDWHFQRVAVALDSAADRRAVQAALPEWIVNAWTQPGDLGVSRHTFLDDQACLTCLC